jgi:PIN domain nuclease of toxin-antitoxin system
VRLLLDSHALIWWVEGHKRLPERVIDAIDTAEAVYVSSVSAMEITTKHRIGKLPQVAALVSDFSGRLVFLGFEELSLTVAHARAAGAFLDPHKDPFDRMLIAQALLEGLVLVSNEELFDRFGVQRLW